MKYLKKFNEELNSQTYLRAANKLKKFGNKTSLDRAEKLKDWASQTERKEYMVKWKKNVDRLSKFGIIKGIVKGEQISFYYDFSFDSLNFEDTLEIEKENNPENFSAHIPLTLWLTPTTEEDVEKCLESIPDDYFSNGQLQAFYIAIDFSVVNNAVEFTGFSFYPEDEVLVSMTSNAASKILLMLSKLFTDRNLNYPSSDTRYNTEYEHLNAVICMENGLSVDYGFELSDVSDYIKTVPKQKLM
jgi:hypothetical protein